MLLFIENTVLISDYVAGGELFTHLYQREHFTKDQVRIYIGEIILALEHLHSVSLFLYLIVDELRGYETHELAKRIAS